MNSSTLRVWRKFNSSTGKNPMKNRKIPRPGDYIRLTNSVWGEHNEGKKFVVVEASYTNGISFATHSFAWVELEDCEYAGRASDSRFFQACRQSERSG